MQKSNIHNEKFDFENSIAYKQITTKYFFPTIRLSELVIISDIISMRTNGAIKAARDIKRKKELMYKWFNENWYIIEPHLPHIRLFNDKNEELNSKFLVSKNK